MLSSPTTVPSSRTEFLRSLPRFFSTVRGSALTLWYTDAVRSPTGCEAKGPKTLK
ncbi:hypothetical protein WG66_004585 [Moniliophthora roreri]|nr:hypothetical protein WG66_004585 [Moniliophthora roreri]